MARCEHISALFGMQCARDEGHSGNHSLAPPDTYSQEELDAAVAQAVEAETMRCEVILSGALPTRYFKQAVDAIRARGTR